MKRLVFTSAGDNTNFEKLWISNEKNYDIFVVYYGDNDKTFSEYESKVQFITKRKGSKFQNFYFLFLNYYELISSYDYFFILDDDIIISASDIQEMFSIAERYNLSICGPSFLPESKISFLETVHKKDIFLEYTNFVEVNVPLFSKSALFNLMKVYNPILIGWGIDLLYIWFNGSDKKEDYAIIHKITCINPEDEIKPGGKRELELIKNWDTRDKIWLNYAKEINCPLCNVEMVCYSSIKMNTLP
jgi:hypothetical protein